MAIKLKIGRPIKKESSRDILYGTGFTKKLVIKQKKANKLIIKTIIKPNITEQKQLTDNIEKLTSVLPDSSLTDNIILDADQEIALSGMLAQKYACLIGSAGTGKTTTLKELVKQIELHMTTEDGDLLEIAFCSFMGKAVQQIKRAVSEDYHDSCKTIHRLLGFKPTTIEYLDEDGNPQTKMRFLPEFTEYNKLPYRYLIIDESGTVPVPLGNQLLAALIPECRIFLLGDLNQLTPVAGHSILGFAMLKWPVFELKTLHRNAGPIAENAHRVIKGRRPITDKETNKVIIKTIADGSMEARKEILSIVRYLYEKGKFDPMQDAIIVPQNINTLGQEQLNEILVNLFNPTAKRIAIKAGSVTKVFAVGDKIMILKNNNAANLTNGMQGIITSIVPNNNFAGNYLTDQKNNSLAKIDLSTFDFNLTDINTKGYSNNEESESERAASHIITVQFQDIKEPQMMLTVGELSHITLSYVFTCHKALGSEYRFIISVCHASTRIMLSREWLYTAITRAKDRLLILYNNRGLSHAVTTQRIKGNTIQQKAQKFISMSKTIKDEEKLNLPDAVNIIRLKINFNLGE